MHWNVGRRRDPIVHERLANRRNDASDADWAIYLKAAQLWEECSDETLAYQRILCADGTPEQTLARANVALKQADLI